VDISELREIPPWEWPQDTAGALKALLLDRHSPAEDRLTAADLAGESVVMDEDMADLLRAIVAGAEEPPELRSKAAISLGPVLEETEVEGFEDDFSDPPIGEDSFRRIQETLRSVCLDERIPKSVRRSALEASVRAEEDWHEKAVREAYSKKDPDWLLTAVFCMRYVSGFDREILASLENPNPDIHYQAVCAAGARGLDRAWPHVQPLLTSPNTAKPLMLAAIEAAGSIHSAEAYEILGDLCDSEDPEIAEAADEALMMAQAEMDYEDEDEEE
jgi:hypothetical protein